MEERSTGMSWIAVLFVIIVVVAIFGGNLGGGWGWNRSGNPYPAQEGGCNRVSNCQVEKQGIVDAARTQYLIEQQSNSTRGADHPRDLRLQRQHQPLTTFAMLRKW